MITYTLNEYIRKVQWSCYLWVHVYDTQVCFFSVSSLFSLFSSSFIFCFLSFSSLALSFSTFTLFIMRTWYTYTATLAVLIGVHPHSTIDGSLYLHLWQMGFWDLDGVGEFQIFMYEVREDQGNWKKNDLS